MHKIKQPFMAKVCEIAFIITHVWDYATMEWAYGDDDRCDPDCPQCAEDAYFGPLEEKLWTEQFDARHQAIRDLLEPLWAQEASLMQEYSHACDALRKRKTDKAA